MNKPDSTGRGRILVVDDNEMNRDMLSRRLERQGHSVSTAVDGVGAIGALGATDFDVVLLDIMMPGMSGFEVLERMKADERLRHIPVIMISALDEVDSVVKAIELGADDYLPKPFNPVILRARVSASLDRKRLHDLQRSHAARMEHELDVGRRIQAGFLPAELPQGEEWEIAGRFRAAREVGGDFYDAFPVGAGRIALVIADVCDKGVGAALFMALFRTLLRALAQQDLGDPTGRVNLARAISGTSDYVATTHGAASMFATCLFAVLDPATGNCLYVNGGHEPAIILGAGGVSARLEPTGPSLGLAQGMGFAIGEATIGRGETLLLYTDGVSEARNPAGDFLGEDRLLELIAAPAGSVNALLDRLLAGVDGFRAGAPQSDDVTMLAVRRS